MSDDPTPTDGTLHAVLAEVAADHPVAPAVVAGERVFSHGEMLGAARSVARRLAGRGVRRGDVVGVVLAPSVELVVALVGVLHAGAAHAWADPSWDPARLARLLAAAGVTRVLGDAATAARHPALTTEPFHLLRLDRADEAVMGEQPSPDVARGEPACVLLAPAAAEEDETTPAPRVLSHHDLDRLAAAQGAGGTHPEPRAPRSWSAANDLAAGGSVLWSSLAAGGAVRVAAG